LRGRSVTSNSSDLGNSSDFGKFSVLGMLAEGERLAPGLHVVATPIGNLKDMSLRALGTLASADVILAEDKRVTKTLLAHYGITTPMISYHEHNAEEMRPKVLAALKEGKALALVSDAGTPLVSDPGFRLVEAAVAEGYTVSAVPGASAVLAALVMAGLPSDRFFFEGFLPSKSGERRRRLRELETIPATLVFFEAPHRVVETLVDLAAIFGPRPAALARELTKKFETVRRGTLEELATQFEAEGAPKGEIVLVIGSPPDEAPLGDEGIDAALRKALQTHTQRDAVALVSAELGLPRKKVYARALQMDEKNA
jgi:16S rRNA (cytidine1402-2'-O)-methyltransferase